MRIHKCWFCSASIYPGHGLTFVRSDANVFRFCRSKCFSLFKRRLNPRKIKWTKISRQSRGKELSRDPVMAFERRVHAPPIYSRETVQATVDAIPRILALKSHRADMFVRARILAAKESQKERDLAFIERHGGLLDRSDAQTAGTVRRLKILKGEKRQPDELEYN